MTNVRSIKKLPSPEEIIREAPLSLAAADGVMRAREEIKAVLDGRDKRLLVIVGPCSAWPSEAVLEYAELLRRQADALREDLLVVLRVYIQKPRTTRGWTGPVNQPDPFAPPDIAAGIRYARRLMVEVAEMGLPIADEALFTHNAKGFLELLSWVAIGARSSEDQEHRIWASAVSMPVGMKNPTSGCIHIGTNSVLAVQHPHVAVFDGHQVETGGNPYAHLVLRGGLKEPNYSVSDLYLARRMLREKGVNNPALLVDASHDNCRVDGQKRPEVQVDVVRDVLESLCLRGELCDTVKGFCVESFLKAGAQSIDALVPDTVDRGGLSITDPCLGWEPTEELLVEMARAARALRSAPPLRAHGS
jgi:3-deoxy-7-phosphoheptulonate synthase